jgi:hypothetical protein
MRVLSRITIPDNVSATNASSAVPEGAQVGMAGSEEDQATMEDFLKEED